MLHLLFYIEAYDAKQFNLVRIFSSYEIEFYLDQAWRSPGRSEAIKMIAGCNHPRTGEDCFYSKYNMRFAKSYDDLDVLIRDIKQCTAIAKILKANNVTCEIDAKIGIN